MRVGPTTPIVPSVVSPALNGAVTMRGLPLAGRRMLGADRHVAAPSVEPTSCSTCRSPARARASRTDGAASPAATPASRRPGSTRRRPRRGRRPRPVAPPAAVSATCSNRSCSSAGLLGGQLQQPRLRIRVGHRPGAPQAPLGLASASARRAFGPVDDLFVDPAVLADGQDHDGRAHVDQLEADDRLLRGARRDREPRVLREPREQLHAPLSTSSRSRIASAK